MNIVGDIITNVIRGAVKKAVDGFVAKGQIRADQAPVLVEGVMLELQIALEMYQASKKP